MKKVERLRAVIELIDSNQNYERSFDLLLSKLNEEISIERRTNSDRSTNGYLNNLIQTLEKQAREYQDAKAKRPVKGAYREFKAFVDHFRQDVSEAIFLAANS